MEKPSSIDERTYILKILNTLVTYRNTELNKKHLYDLDYLYDSACRYFGKKIVKAKIKELARNAQLDTFESMYYALLPREFINFIRNIHDKTICSK